MKHSLDADYVVRVIEVTIVVFSIIHSVYIFSPLYPQSVVVNGLTPFAAALSLPVLVYVYMSGIFISALVLGAGVYWDKPNLRAMGLFWQFLLRFYNVSTTLLMVGFTPFLWIYHAILVAICMELWLMERLQHKNVRV